MGCDKPENLPASASSFHAFDDLALSIRQSGAVNHSGVSQGGLSLGANVASIPFTSLPIVRPLPGIVPEMNNIQLASLKNLNSLQHPQLQPNSNNVRNIAPRFPTLSEMAGPIGNVAEVYHSNMSNNLQTSDMNGDALSTGIQNRQSNVTEGYPSVESAAKATGLSQNSLRTSASPVDVGYNIQNTINIGEIGIHDNVKVNPVPFPSPKKFDGSFLTLGIGSNMEDKSKFRFSAKEVSSKLEEAVLPQINSSRVQETRQNSTSLVHGVPGGVANFSCDSGGMSNSVWNSSSNNDEVMLAPRTRISASPFVYSKLPSDMRLNSSSNSRGSGSVGKADHGFSELDTFMSSQGNLTPSPLPVSSNSAFTPHHGYAKMVGAPESAQPAGVTAQRPTAQQQNWFANNIRNQYIMDSPFFSSGGGTMRQDHLAQQSFIGHVNAVHPCGNNLFPERIGPQVAELSGIQPAPGNDFPRRLGVQLNDGAISQASRAGVLPRLGGIQQIEKGNSYQSRDHGPAMLPTELRHPPPAIGRPQGGLLSHFNVSGVPYHAGQGTPVQPQGGLPPHFNVSGVPYQAGQGIQVRPQGGLPAHFNVSGLPYHAGQGLPVPKLDVTPQAPYIHGHSSLKRRANKPPPISSAGQRRRTVAQHSNQQLIPHHRPIINSVHASSPALPLPHVKWEGFETSSQCIGEKCLLCKRDLAFTPEGPVSQPAAPPAIAVLPCGHVFHDHCLQIITPGDQSKEPPCIPCAIGET